MTTIAAFLDDKGRVALGADTALTGHTQLHLHSKLRKVGKLWVSSAGVALCYRFLDDIASMKGAKKLNPQDIADLMVEKFQEMGSGTTTPDGNWGTDMGLLIVKKGESPYSVAGDGFVTQVTEEYGAEGSGDSVALGVLHVARQEGWSAERAVKTALEAACHHDPWTSVPYHIKVLG